VTESLIPLVTEKISQFQQKKKLAAYKKDDSKKSPDFEVCTFRI